MKQIVDFLKKAFISALPYLLLLLFVMAIYGFGDIFKLGYYSDDWTFPYHLSYLTDKSFFGILQSKMSMDLLWLYRAPQVLVSLPFNYLGANFIQGSTALQFGSMFYNYILILIGYQIILKVTKNVPIAVICSIFIISFPGKSSNFFWPATYLSVFSNICFFSVVLVALSELSQVVKLYLIFVLTLVGFWAYETIVFLPLIVLLILYFNKNNLKEIVGYTLSSSLGITFILVFKFIIYPKVLGQYSYKVLPQTANIDPLSKLSFIFEYTLSFFRSYFFTFRDIMYQSFTSSDLLSLITVSVIGLLLLYFYKSRLSYKHVSKSLFFIGVTIFFASLAVLSIMTNELPAQLSLYGNINRTFTLASIAVGIIILSLIRRLFFSNTIFILIVCILTSYNLRIVNVERKTYIDSWSKQKIFLRNLQTIDTHDKLKTGRPLVALIINQKLTESYLNVPIISDPWTPLLMFRTNYRNKNLYLNVYPNKQTIYKTRAFSFRENDKKLYFDTSNVYIMDTIKNQFYKY